jgi:hypothetical protein
MSGDYPTFEPPVGIGRGDARHWSPDEARGYFVWLRGTAPKRAELFLRAVGLHWQEPSPEFLELISKRFEQGLIDPRFRVPFREVSQYQPAHGFEIALSSQGEAFCSDAGLLLGLLLLQFEPRLYWRICDDAELFYFNRPVIAGFAGGAECEPVSIGSNLGGRIVNGRQRAPGREFVETYEWWLNNIERRDLGERPP